MYKLEKVKWEQKLANVVNCHLFSKGTLKYSLVFMKTEMLDVYITEKKKGS